MSKPRLRPAKTVKTDILAACATAKALGGTIHELAVECLQHAMPQDEGGHGNATLLQTLYLELPASQRREALLKWAEKYSPVRVTQKGAKCGILPEDAKNFVPFDIEGAQQNPYWELDERTGFNAKPMDIGAFLNTSLKRATEAKMRAEANIWTPPDGYDAEREITRITVAAEALSLELKPVDTTKISEAIATELARTTALAA